MKTRVDATLLAQAAEFAFRFACEDCAHFDAARERCSLAYPAAPRRVALREPEITLCKTFELG